MSSSRYPFSAGLVRGLRVLLLLLSSSLAARAGQLPGGQHNFTTSDSVRLYVRVAGQGQPCLFVHGGPGAGSQAVEVLAGARPGAGLAVGVSRSAWQRPLG